MAPIVAKEFAWVLLRAEFGPVSFDETMRRRTSHCLLYSPLLNWRGRVLDSEGQYKAVTAVCFKSQRSYTVCAVSQGDYPFINGSRDEREGSPVQAGIHFRHRKRSFKI